ncbi:MAG: helix-turn-helix transcriptional regulator [Bacteroidota bacterium]
MKGLRSIPKILKINSIDGYTVSCLFNNGESRIIDFEQFFKNVNAFSEKHPAFNLTQDIDAFKKMEVIGNSIGWKNIGINSKNFEGETVFYPYELDPIVLFENSTIDKERTLIVGLLIRQARKEAGLTQQELAQKSGTSKHYISRLENNKSDIELLTLKKIIEAGLGKTLSIQIH